MSRALMAGLAMAAGLMGWMSQPAQPGQPGQATVLRGARVIDGSGGAPIENATVIIGDGKIVAVLPASAAAIETPPGAQVFDYKGKTIIPGLISDHSHVGIV